MKHSTRILILALLSVACAGRTGPDSAVDRGVEKVKWEEVRREIEAHVCMREFEVPGYAPFVEPVYGVRAACELPIATTALEIAVERAWEQAAPMISATRHEWLDDARASVSQPDEASMLAAAREVYLRPRSMNELLRHLHPALAEVGLACPSCPMPEPPVARTVSWEEFEPYLSAYVWPEPVEPEAEATTVVGYELRICIGDNGIHELQTPDGALVELGFLAAFHTQLVHDGAFAEFQRLQADPEFTARSGDERTRWLRAAMAGWVTSDAEVVREVCATIERFRGSTGITVLGCESSS